MDRCEIHDQLARAAHDHLKKLADIARRQMEAFDAGDEGRFGKLDRELELAVGEKERVIGRLRQHDEEHGCQG